MSYTVPDGDAPEELQFAYLAAVIQKVWCNIFEYGSEIEFISDTIPIIRITVNVALDNTIIKWTYIIDLYECSDSRTAYSQLLTARKSFDIWLAKLNIILNEIGDSDVG